jgi:hypothetical protein
MPPGGVPDLKPLELGEGPKGQQSYCFYLGWLESNGSSSLLVVYKLYHKNPILYVILIQSNLPRPRPA